jgi:hypothetical protein
MCSSNGKEPAIKTQSPEFKPHPTKKKKKFSQGFQRGGTLVLYKQVKVYKIWVKLQNKLPHFLI